MKKLLIVLLFMFVLIGCQAKPTTYTVVHGNEMYVTQESVYTVDDITSVEFAYTGKILVNQNLQKIDLVYIDVNGYYYLAVRTQDIKW